MNDAYILVPQHNEYCWVILRFGIWLIFLLSLFSYLFLSVKAVKGIKDGRKKTGIPLDSVVFEYFPESVEITLLLETKHLKNILESSLANYKFEGQPCVSVFSGYIQQSCY